MAKTGRAAEFRGHCQVCGSFQKLPKNVLSLHGYNVAYGFFSGVCSGAKSLPFEKSCDLVKKSIVSATAELARVEARIADLRTPATEPKAWVSVYRPATWKHRSSRSEWLFVDVVAVVHESTYGTYTTFDYSYEHEDTNGTKSTKTASIEAPYDAPKFETVLDACSFANRKLAGALEEKTVANLKSYIAFQTARVASWKEADLFPVDAKSTAAAFEPTSEPVIKEAK